MKQIPENQYFCESFQHLITGTNKLHINSQTYILKIYSYIFIILFSLILFSCGDKKSDFIPKATVADYFPLQIGKYITYRLDSTIFVKTGSQIEVHQYQVKHTIAGTTTDNLGRQTFIINKVIRNVNSTGEWRGDGSYLVTPLENSVEVVENNLRVIKIVSPLVLGTTWNGNSHLVADPYATIYDMQAGKNMNQWAFTYYNFGDTTVDNNTYKDVWSVQQNNEVLNIPPGPETNLGLKEVGFEKYAKGIGMVYRNYEIYDYQSGYVDNGQQPTYTGFGITMWMIDHN